MHSISGVALRLQTLLVLLLAFVLLLLVGGCFGGSLDEQFVKAVDSNWKVMGSDYGEYIKKDEVLSDASRERRLKAIAEFTLLVDEAKAKLDE